MIGRAKPPAALLTNSFYLMLASAGSAAFGFVFWVLVARHFNAATVGLATTLLTAGGFLSLLGLAGFDTIFVRFLGKAKRPNAQISTGLLMSALVTAALCSLFCLLVPMLSPHLVFVARRPLFVGTFVLFGVLSSWNVLSNAIITAYRQTSYVLFVNILFGMVRVILPFVVHRGGPMTVFGIVTAALAINVALSLAVIGVRFGYRPSLRIDRQILRETRRYGVAVYVASVCNLLPDSALPLIVINRLGAAAAAYFYVAFTIANLLYTIAFSTTQALLAEAAFDEAHLVQHVRRALGFITALMAPAVIAVVAVCPLVLELFGHGYRGGASGVLRVLGLSGLIVALYSLCTAVFKLVGNLRAVIFTTATNAIAIVSLSLWLVPRGLNAVGWAWLIGNVASIGVGAWFMRGQLRAALGQLRTPPR